jgi:hypothetical protein
MMKANYVEVCLNLLITHLFALQELSDKYLNDI